jgi:hypothetical protein
MSMKRLMVMAMLAAVPLGCVANQGDASVRLMHALFLKSQEGEGASEGGCTADPASVISSGSYDVSGKQNYLLALSVETNTLEQPVVINGETFSGEGLSDITLNEVIYSYESQPSITLPADEEDRTPIYRVFRPGSDPGGSYMFVRAFGAKAVEALATAVPCSDTNRVTVLTTMKMRGRLSGGQVVETNEITFPVTVFNSGFNLEDFTCGDVTETPLGGTCGRGGQNAPICPSFTCSGS